jgi:rubrerythrin
MAAIKGRAPGRGAFIWGCEWCPRTFQTKTLAELHEIGTHMRERVSAARGRARTNPMGCPICGSKTHFPRSCPRRRI